MKSSARTRRPDTEKKGELPITINVWVSAGEDVGTMPDLTTKPMTYDQAMTILQDLVAEYELNVQPYEETQKEYDDELAVDVIKSTTPAANEELHKGDTITFVLSRGPGDRAADPDSHRIGNVPGRRTS